MKLIGLVPSYFIKVIYNIPFLKQYSKNVCEKILCMDIPVYKIHEAKRKQMVYKITEAKRKQIYYDQMNYIVRSVDSMRQSSLPYSTNTHII